MQHQANTCLTQTPPSRRHTIDPSLIASPKSLISFIERSCSQVLKLNQVLKVCIVSARVLYAM